MDDLPAGLLVRISFMQTDDLLGLLTAEFTDMALLHFRSDKEPHWCLHTEATEAFTFRGETPRECVSKALLAYYHHRAKARLN